MTTLIQHILKEEKNFLKASGSFTVLLACLENASKIIASHVRQSGLADIEGQTGEKNAYGDEVQKLDEIANNILIKMLGESGQVNLIGSEELAEPIVVAGGGEYQVFFDPLDGSSLVETNGSIGTIFSIYKNKGQNLLAGREQAAAGYIIYGSSTIFVYTTGSGVNGFTFDSAAGLFVLSHQNIKIPEEAKTYSINEGNSEYYSKDTISYLSKIKKNIPPYKLRYMGSMVGDIHHALIKGGIYLYPADAKNPEGKIRLLYEANPLAFIVEQAGGKAVSNNQNILDITPNSLDHKLPVIIGSLEEVNKYFN